ncbi:hypothetical protein WH50_13130 [Pokkaliibacter plantistimulans]|uniref:Uncharacterized protein n=1 Tax=Pokkaliibacter plantistimulans TaxID=1635171 RepID=A0ABX5LZG1_9GAMM|nr:hypothetical protein WH50_13130 [Pokkaliibacter plantistimulans]
MRPMSQLHTIYKFDYSAPDPAVRAHFAPACPDAIIEGVAMRIGNTLPAFTAEEAQHEQAIANKLLFLLVLVTVCVGSLLAIAVSV